MSSFSPSYCQEGRQGERVGMEHWVEEGCVSLELGGRGAQAPVLKGTSGQTLCMTRERGQGTNPLGEAKEMVDPLSRV